MKKPAPNQRPIFAGLDCLPGQQDLFPTDGPRADETCDYCLSALPFDEGFVAQRGDSGSRYCCAACFDAGERELAEMRR